MSNAVALPACGDLLKSWRFGGESPSLLTLFLLSSTSSSSAQLGKIPECNETGALYLGGTVYLLLPVGHHVRKHSWRVRLHRSAGAQASPWGALPVRDPRCHPPCGCSLILRHLGRAGKLTFSTEAPGELPQAAPSFHFSHVISHQMPGVKRSYIVKFILKENLKAFSFNLTNISRMSVPSRL